MAIVKVSDNNTRYHLRELQILQGRIANENEDPKYSLSFVVEEYTLDSESTRTYTGTVHTHFVNEFYTEAITELLQGNNTHVNSLNAVQLTIAHYLGSVFGYTVEIL